MKKIKNLYKKLVLVFAVTLVLAGFSSQNIFAATVASGWYIQDYHCYISHAEDDGDIGRSCLLMDSCAASGYGVWNGIPYGQTGSHFYFFDGSYFPNQTGGQAQAYDFLNDDSLPDFGIKVDVDGTLYNNIITVNPNGIAEH